MKADCLIYDQKQKTKDNIYNFIDVYSRNHIKRKGSSGTHFYLVQCSTNVICHTILSFVSPKKLSILTSAIEIRLIQYRTGVHGGKCKRDKKHCCFHRELNYELSSGINQK